MTSKFYRKSLNCDEAETIGGKIQEILDGISAEKASIKPSDKIKSLVSLHRGVTIEKKTIYILFCSLIDSFCWWSDQTIRKSTSGMS